ncbi:MAG: DsbA family protein, partial [Prevotella sp.]|nr:DsbA family protein [Prevotella sp.]
KGIGLDIPRFEKDFGKDEILEKIENDYSSGEEMGVEGTPMFFVNGQLYSGNWASKDFLHYLESLV